MSTITRESIFILLKVIKRHEDKRPEGGTKLVKLKAIINIILEVEKEMA